ncbi:MAG: SCO family protein [Hyphomicrobiales bacterium]
MGRPNLIGRAAIAALAAVAVVLGAWLLPRAFEPPTSGAPTKGAPDASGASGTGPGAFDYEPPEPGTYDLPAIERAADGRVLDETGRPIRLRSLFDGRVTVLSFIYTRCADATACPMATGVLRDLHDATRRDPDLAKRVRLITFSFDAEHDTPTVMARYAEAARGRGGDGGAEWLFLTAATPGEVKPTLERYGQLVSRKPDPNDPLGPFYHLLRVFLIDRTGTVRNIYSTGFLDSRLVLADVRTLLLEDEGRGADARGNGARRRPTDGP